MTHKYSYGVSVSQKRTLKGTSLKILPLSPRFFALQTVSMETTKLKIQNGGKNNDLKAK